MLRLLLFSIVILWLLTSPVKSAGNATNSSSHSHKSHSKSHDSKSKSHKSHSHKSHSKSHHSHSKSHESHSHSQSHSYGHCNATSVVYDPSPMPPAGVNITYPLWPLKALVHLKGNNNLPHLSGIWVQINYNYTYYHIRNPTKVTNCNLAPDLSKIPYITEVSTYSDNNGDASNCNRICTISFYLSLQCPLVDLSGVYNVNIPYVGTVELDLDVCVNDGIDYGLPCADVPTECSLTSQFTSGAPACVKKDHDGLSKADKVGISFGVVGGVMFIVIVILAILYVNLQNYYARNKSSV